MKNKVSFKINLDDLFKITEHIIYRWEPKIENGTLFIFNYKQGRFFKLNKPYYIVFSLLKKGPMSMIGLIDEISSNQSDKKDKYCVIIKNMISELLEKGLIKVAKNDPE